MFSGVSGRNFWFLNAMFTVGILLPFTGEGDHAKRGGGGSILTVVQAAPLSTKLRLVHLSRRRERNADCERRSGKGGWVSGGALNFSACG